MAEATSIKSFNTGRVIMPDGKKIEAIEVHVFMDKKKNSTFFPVWTQIIKTLDIGAWRIKPEVTTDNEGKVSYSCRYFSGDPKDYINAKHPS